MMGHKKITMVMLLGGVSALALRLWQTFTGFEEDTGLAVSGHPAGIALPVVLVLLAVVMVLLSRRLPGEQEGRGFEQSFFAESAERLTLVVMGIFTMAASGVLQLLFGFMGGGLQNVLQDGGMMVSVVWMGAVSPVEVMLLGGMAVVSAVCLFPAVIASRRGARESGPINGSLLLVPVICLVVRMVMVYRINSVDPVLQGYYVELLAVTFVALALYQLTGYVYGQGKFRRYAICSGLALVLCMTTLGDGHDISGMLFYAGCGLSVLGFWLLYRPDGDTQEEAYDPSVN